MQGIVIDEKSGTIEAAIVKIIKTQKSEEGNDEEAVTYARTDENGRFFIKEMDPEEEYIIEIHLEEAESKAKTNNSADEQKEDNMITDTVYIDEDIENNKSDIIESKITKETEDIKIIRSDVNEVNQYESDNVKPNHDLRSKLYQIRNNTWW